MQEERIFIQSTNTMNKVISLPTLHSMTSGEFFSFLWICLMISLLFDILDSLELFWWSSLNVERMSMLICMIRSTTGGHLSFLSTLNLLHHTRNSLNGVSLLLSLHLLYLESFDLSAFTRSIHNQFLNTNKLMQRKHSEVCGLNACHSWKWGKNLNVNLLLALLSWWILAQYCI